VQSLSALKSAVDEASLTVAATASAAPGSAKGASTPRGAASGRVQHPEITRDCSLYLSLTGSPLWVKNQSADPHLLQPNRPNRITSPPILAGPNGSSNLPNSRREIQRRKHQAAGQNFTDQTGAHDELRYTQSGVQIVWLQNHRQVSSTLLKRECAPGT
jgi:hypothetical protein